MIRDENGFLFWSKLSGSALLTTYLMKKYAPRHIISPTIIKSV